MNKYKVDYLERIKSRDFLKFREFVPKGNISSKLLFGNRGISPPELSIVIPTFNRTDSLEKCIRSVITQETTLNFELVIVDNNPEHIKGSSILSLIRKINDTRILYYCNEVNLGAMGNWNRCFQLANGHLVSMVHDDDFVHPNWLITMESVFTKLDGNCDILVCKYCSIHNDEESKKFSNFVTKDCDYEQIRIGEMFQRFSAPVLGAWIRRGFFFEIGGFVEDCTKFEDYIFMAVAVCNGKVISINQKLYGYVVGTDNDSNNDVIWNDIIIGEYYFRRSFVQHFGYTTRQINYLICRLKVIKSIISHTMPYLKLSDFCNVRLNIDYIISNCNISREFYRFFYYFFIIKLFSITFSKRVIKKIISYER